jgi:serine/threonine-protein kinase RsbW
MTLSPKLGPNRFQCELASRLKNVDEVCKDLRVFLQSNGLAADGFVIELLVREALNNAILHGNRKEPGKRARLTLCLGRRWLRLQIEDQGSGFDWRRARSSIPEVQASRGRGMFISALYADRVAFNRRGNQITLWLENSERAKRYQHGNIHA